MRYKIPILIVLMIQLVTSLSAQNNTLEHDDHDHGHHEHSHDHKNEIGIANSPVYFIKEKEFNYGIHVHYIQSIGKSRFGIGLGYERIFDEHRHQTFGVVCSYRLMDRLAPNISPGITFESDTETPSNFVLHVETS